MNERFFTIAALAEELEAFIAETIPKCTTVQKYGGTLFTLKPDEKEGQFCGVFVYKQHAQISFSKGAELKDTTGLLQGSGKRRRHINFTSLDNVNLTDLKNLLQQASKL